MSFVLANRVKETTLTTGTGILSLLGAVSSFQSFGSVLSSGDQTYYTLSNSTQWEVGVGTYLGNSLRRDSVFSSSNSNNFVNLSGSTNVFIAYPAEKSVYKNTNNQIVVGSNGLLFSDGTTQTTAPTGVGGGSGTTYSAGTGLNLTGTVFSIDNTVIQSGDNISLFVNDSNYLTSSNSGDLQSQITTNSSNISLLIASTGSYLTEHPAITAASSSDNSGRTYIQDIFLDENGHVTGISVATETGVGGGGTTYFAGTGLTLDVNTFNIDSTVIQSGDNISLLVNNVGYLSSESDTLQTVTTRGATTSDNILFNGLITASTGIKLTQGIPADTTNTIYFDDKLKFQESGIVLLPDGGLEGQILYKTSDTNGLSWVDNYAQELRETVQNDTASQITKGTVVMAVGAAGDTISVAPAVADGSILAKYMLGIASENIAPSGGRGYTTFFGPFKGFNTNAYEVGDILYIDPLNPGGLTVNQPVSPNLTMPIAIVTKVGNSSAGRLFVRMWVQQAGLNELYDVNSSGAVNGDIISYDGSIWSLDSSVARSGDNISIFSNDAGYITSLYADSASGFLQSEIDSLVANTGSYLTQHPIIAAASSSDNSNRTYIQNILLDENGHVTGITTATETGVGGGGSTYFAGTGLTLNIDTFNIDSTVIQSGDNLSYLYNDTGYITSSYVDSASGDLQTQITSNANSISLLIADTGNYLQEHPVISAAASSDNSGRTYIQDILLDSNGHVTGVAVATETVVDTNTTYTAGNGLDLTGTVFSIDNTVVQSGDNISVLVNDAGYLTTHPVISTSGSSDNSGRTYVQDIFLDSNGHVIGINTATETVVDTNTTYTAGDGLNLAGTVFSVNNLVIQSGDNISLLVNDSGYINAELNDLTGNVTWANVPDANITESSVVQHSGAIRITESQIVDLQSYLTAHPVISAATSSDNSGRTYIQDILLDSNGHVTGVTTATETVVDTDTTYTAGTGLDLIGTVFSIDNTVVQSGDNVSLLVNDAGYLTSHPTISTSGSSDNSGRTYIQDIFLDGNGHVVGINTATETVIDTDTTYSAGTGITLNGTTFDVNLVDLTTQSIAANAVTSTASRTYAVQVNSNDQLVVNVPWESGGGGGGTYTAGTGLTLIGSEFHTYGTGNFDQITFDNNEIELGIESDADTYGISIGYRAGKLAAGYAMMDADYSIYIGYYAGFESYSCFSSTFIGNGAGYQTNNVDYSNFIGDGAGQLVKDSLYNNYIGFEAGYDSSGDFNNYIGYTAGYQASGDKNIEIVSSGGLIGPHSNKLNIGNVLVGDTSTKELALGNVTSANLTPEATLHIVSAPSDLSLKVDGSGQFVGQLNLGVSGVRYSDGSEQKSLFSPVSSTAATGITLLATDIGKYIRTTAATAVTVTVPSGLSIPNYSEFVFEQAGAGQITLSPAAGVTINTSSSLTSAAQYSVIGIKQVSANIYTAFGDRT